MIIDVQNFQLIIVKVLKYSDNWNHPTSFSFDRDLKIQKMTSLRQQQSLKDKFLNSKFQEIFVVHFYSPECGKLRCVKKGWKFFKRKWLDFEENDNETVLRNQVVRKTREIERTKKMGKKFFVEKKVFLIHLSQYKTER